MSAKIPVLVCTGGIYSICFPEGYLILTESIGEAQAVCASLGLRPNPYWWPLPKVYDSKTEAEYCINIVLNALGPAGIPLVSCKPKGAQWEVTYYGFISTL